GRVIPLADIGLAFAMAAWTANTDSRIIVIACPFSDQSVLLGVKADRVHEVTTINRSYAEPPPEIGKQWNPEFIRGLIKSPRGLIAIPDLTRIFTSYNNRRQTCVSRLNTN
ncbi:MAG: chemotaxis protein CheW, partial [Rhizomicrobium sp.]